MEPQTPFSSDFKNNLSAGDATFATYLQQTHIRLMAASKIAPNKPLPEGMSLDEALENAANDPIAQAFLGTKVNMVSPGLGATSNKNRTGISTFIPIEKNGKSASRQHNGRITLSEHMCSSCTAPHLAQNYYDCSDLSKPEQVRGGQLMRMAIGLHEIGHSIFSQHVMSSSQIPDNERNNLLAHGKMNENFSDSLFALVMIREGGKEGLSFVKQYAAGFRDKTNGIDDDHNTSNTLALIIEAAENNIGDIQQMPLQNIVNAALNVAKLGTPTDQQAAQLKAGLAAAGVLSSPQDDPYQKAQSRLAWYEAEQHKARHGEPVNCALLNLYQTYMKHGDQAMMSDDQLSQNLSQMVDLGPLKNNSDWQQGANNAEAECKISQKQSLQKAQLLRP